MGIIHVIKIGRERGGRGMEGERKGGREEGRERGREGERKGGIRSERVREGGK